MGKRSETRQHSRDETLELKNRLEETEETLRAIRQYMVDAFVVTRENSAQVVTLGDAAFPYRMMVEAMNEGAVTLIADGTVFYCNTRFGNLAQEDCEKLIGVRFHDLIIPEQRSHFDELFTQAGREDTRGQFSLQTAQGQVVPVQLSIYRLGQDETSGTSIIATDMTEHLQQESKIRSLASALTIAEQEERHRISQILHDDLQQRLFAIKAQLSFLKAAGEKDGNATEIQVTLDQIQDWLSDAITITRNLSVDMSPAVLRGEGLTETILWLSSRMKEQYGLRIKINARDNLNSLNDHMRVLLFQVIRELLFNVVKHADIGDATITLERFDGRGRITVSDSGKGFDANTIIKDAANTHGLLLIKDRLSLMNGTMTVHSVPGDGTKVVIEFPIEENSK